MIDSAVCVLVLDADEATRTLYQRTLSRKWHVVACASETEANAALNRTRVDAVVVEPSSLNDPEWTFLRRIRSRLQRGNALIPVLVCSTLDQRRMGAELGVAAYLIKPVSPHTLQSALELTLQPLTSSEPETPAAMQDASTI
jgi:response regulator RpfG family c-di-GMP phosphodiesterase